MTTAHSTDCRCANCRALRVARNVDNPPSPGKPLDMGLDPDPEQSERERTQEQILAIQRDPLGFAIAAKEGDVSNEDIIESLNQAGFAEQDVLSILTLMAEYMKATRRRRGFKRILAGVALGIGGAVVSGITIYFAANSGFYLVTTGLFLAAAWYVVRGLWEVATG